MAATVNPTGSTQAPLETTPTTSPARSGSAAAKVTDTVQLTAAAQAAILTPQEAVLDETDNYAQILKAAQNGDLVARDLVAALASVPTPQIP